MEDEKEEKGTNNEEKEQVPEQNEELKFTQSDFNEALKKEIARKTNGMSKEELKEFKQWKESQQSNQNDDEDEKEEKPEDEEKEEPKTKDINEQNAIKEVKVLKSGVDKEFSEFVTYQVSKMEGDFEKNLTKYLKDNPKYLSNNDDTKFIKKVGSSLNLGGGKPTIQTTNQKMNDLIRSSRD